MTLKITTKADRKKIHAVKKYCKPKNCFEVDKGLDESFLDDINSNYFTNITYTCAGHEEVIPKHLDNDRNKPVIGVEKLKMPPGIMFDSYEHNLCPLLEKNIPNTKCDSGTFTRTRYRIEAIKSDKKKNNKWLKDVRRILKDEKFFSDNK